MAPLMSTSVEPFANRAGTANALSLFWRFFCGALIALLISLTSNKHLFVLHFGLASMAVIGGLVFLLVLCPSKFPDDELSHSAYGSKEKVESLTEANKEELEPPRRVCL